MSRLEGMDHSLQVLTVTTRWQQYNYKSDCP